MDPSLEACYAAFAHYPAGDARPLQTLGVDDLYPIMAGVLTSWGTPVDFKHYLPRALELIEELDYTLIFEKLTRAQWQRWPQSEQAAVMEFTLTWFAHSLQGADSISERLSALAGLTPDVTPYLFGWDGGANGVRHLARLVNNHIYDVVDRAGPFTMLSDAQHAQMLAWLYDPSLLAKLSARDSQSEIALAHKTLAAFQREE